MQKISESLRELAEHIEKKVGVAVSGGREKVEATLATSKADVNARQRQLTAKLASRKAAGAADLERVRTEHDQRIGKIKGTVGAKWDTVDHEVSGRWDDDAEDYAASSMDDRPDDDRRR